MSRSVGKRRGVRTLGWGPGPLDSDWGTARWAGPLDPHLVSEDHEAIVRLAPDGPTHALGRVAHGVEGEKVLLADLELVAQVLQPRLWERVPDCLAPRIQPLPAQVLAGGPKRGPNPTSPGAAHLEDAALGVDVGDTKHDDSPPKVVHCGAGATGDGRDQLEGATSCSPGVGREGKCPRAPPTPRNGGEDRPACPGCERAPGTAGVAELREGSWEGRASSTHQSRFPRTLCLEPRTAGWPHGRSRRPGAGRPGQL